MIKRPRGTKDIYGIDEKIYQFIFDTFESLAKSYNLKKIITPTFESYELFKNSNGQDSDIIVKEIYKFKDYSNRELALKPEGTASIGRAILENKLYTQKEYNKLYYIDSMFRYEKPQKGRLRQFYQIGVELTNELSINSIIDAISLANSLLEKLSIKDYVLNINSIGKDSERQGYIKCLKEYFLKNQDSLSELSRSRINTNPLRILDDKNDANLDVVKNAPKISDFWSNETKNEFSQIIKKLEQLSINYSINHSLVRGLDYYSNVVFEFISNSKSLGTKSTLIGGGCYLNLMDNDNKNQINGVGFGVGVERLFEIIKNENQIETNDSIDAIFLIENDNQYDQIQKIIYDLRYLGIKVEYNYEIKKFKKLFEKAINQKVKIIIFQEINDQKTDEWTIKKDGKNIKTSKNQIIENIKKLI